MGCSTSSTISPKGEITLGYWGVKANGEISRLTLAFAGVEFTEWNPKTPQEWGEKKGTLKSEFPNLPFLEHGDFVLTESGAIPWYVARRFKPSLAGVNPAEEAQIRQIIGVIGDAREEVNKAMATADYKTALTAASGKIEGKIAALSKKLGAAQYLVGEHVTLADIFLAYNAYFINKVFASAEVKSPFAQHANLGKHEAHFWTLKELQGYLASESWKKPLVPP